MGVPELSERRVQEVAVEYLTDWYQIAVQPSYIYAALERRVKNGKRADGLLAYESRSGAIPSPSKQNL